MKALLLLVAIFLLWPGFSFQNACEEPDEIDFGEIVSAEKAKYLENNRVQYRCNPGYVLEGSEWIQCKGQEWTPRPPKCLAPCSVTRQQLAAKNLFVFGNQRKARLIQSNQSLQFQCNEGYVLVVPSVRKCVGGNMDLPLCISERGKNCSGPPRTENGDITTSSEKQYRSGSSVEFRCQNHYAMEGQNRSFCDSGTWTKVPICLDPCMIPRTELESQKIEVKDEIEYIFVQHGHSIELTCRTGYVLAANSSQSAFVIHCDGTPPVIPKCKEITCNSPRISNGIFRPQRSIYYDGDLIRIRCDTGFIFEPDNGEKVVECTKNGWSPPPKCIKKSCGRAPKIPNASLEQDDREQHDSGKIINYTCNHGFSSKELTKKICRRGQWVGSFTCKDATCPKPPIVENAQISGDPMKKYMNGEKITYQCNDGFDISGSAAVTCRRNTWSLLPRCLDVRCSSPPEIQNSQIIGEIKEKYLPQETMQYRCNTGYALLGSSIITCLKKRWTQTPRCTDIGGKCGRAPPVENGDIVDSPKGTYLHSESVTYQCQNFYTMRGSPRVTCQNGHWSQTPTCRVACTTSEEDMRKHNIRLKWNNGDKIYSMDGDVVEFECRRGYEPHPNVRVLRVTCVDGKIDYPDCIRI